MKPPMRPARPRLRPTSTGWHREIPGRVRRYFDERRLIKWVVIAGAGCFVLGYLLVTLLFFPGFGRSPIVTVPDLTGRSRAQAERSLDRLGLRMERGPPIANPRMRRGRVLMQTPLPGEEMARGSTVRIVLSDGPEMRQVPSISGLARPDAIGLLQRYGFGVAIRRIQHRSEENSLVGTLPEAGNPAPVGGMVILLVSNGPPRVVVPNVVGLYPGDARVRLQAVGLELGRIRYDPASLDSVGVIIAQGPAAGDSLGQGSGVRVVLAGPDPNPPAPVVDSTAVGVGVDSAGAPAGQEPREGDPVPPPDDPDPDEPPPNEPQLSPRPRPRQPGDSPGGA
ncbi:MAG TPA: PASTA domain-containing protein [Longimicrobium sp.]|nr:PASTA domain-containing protein [Longimicrobium sp.]